MTHYIIRETDISTIAYFKIFEVALNDGTSHHINAWTHDLGDAVKFDTILDAVAKLYVIKETIKGNIGIAGEIAAKAIDFANGTITEGWDKYSEHYKNPEF